MTHHISANTEICGLIGDPVEHSISPAIHNAAFKKLSIWVHQASSSPQPALRLVVEHTEVLKQTVEDLLFVYCLAHLFHGRCQVRIPGRCDGLAGHRPMCPHSG